MAERVSTGLLDEQQVWEALKDVPDPELPAISVVDMGIVRQIQVDTAASSIRVDITPTFAGCPALSQIRLGIAERLQQLASHVEVNVTMKQAWTSDLLSEEARNESALNMSSLWFATNDARKCLWANTMSSYCLLFQLPPTI